jgi:hypothetical protein
VEFPKQASKVHWMPFQLKEVVCVVVHCIVHELQDGDFVAVENWLNLVSEVVYEMEEHYEIGQLDVQSIKQVSRQEQG